MKDGSSDPIGYWVEEICSLEFVSQCCSSRKRSKLRCVSLSCGRNVAGEILDGRIRSSGVNRAVHQLFDFHFKIQQNQIGQH